MLPLPSPDIMAAVTSASNTMPIVVTASEAIDATSGELKIAGISGNEAANGSFHVKPTDSTNQTFELYSDLKLTKPVAGTGAYQSGGAIYRAFLKDYAIVVGINNYPDPAMNPLRGPEADASSFCKWLIAPTGGIVPMRNVKRILSSDYPVPDPQDFTTWQPALDALKAMFWRYSDIALKNDVQTGDARVGRRLWVFLSGHGITPAKAPSVDLDDAALLAASAAPGRYGEHLTAYSWIQWFKNAAAFDEIVLFMDCCRDLKLNVPPIPCTLEPMVKDRRSDVRILYAAATDLDSQSWEDQIGTPPEYHGFFSYVLMQALYNDALLDRHGRLTASNLIAHLKKEVPKYCKDQKPRFLPDPPQDITLLQKRTGLSPNVQVTFGPSFLNQEALVFRGDDLIKPYDRHTVTKDPWSLRLDAFTLFKFVVPGAKPQTLEVSADPGENCVNFV